jgi:cell shape-determining protein MreD
MRRSILAAIPVLPICIILQTSIVSRISLLSGNADLLLLVVIAWGLQERNQAAWIWGLGAALLVGFISGVPVYIYILAYLSSVVLSRLMAKRIWQAPLLAMFTVTLIGTLELLMLTYVQRILSYSPLPFNNVFSQIVLPSVLLNLLWAMPVNATIRAFSRWVYPERELA